MQNNETVNQLSKLILQKYSSSKLLTLVAISGAAALGKTTLAVALKNNITINTEKIIDILPTDAFLMSRRVRNFRKISGYDPRATNIDKLCESVRCLLEGNSVSFYPYDHYAGNTTRQLVTLMSSDILILDGIHSFHSELRGLMDLKIFLDAKREVAIKLRSIVDTNQRGYSYCATSSTAYLDRNNYELHVRPYIDFADVIVQVNDNWKYEIIS